MADLYKYGVAVHLYKPIVKRAVVDFAVSADWTPAAGDVKISKDGGAAANVTNLPTAITMGNTALWDYSLTATEMQAAKIRITVADSATKAVEDTAFEIDTYGNASAQHQVDLADSVRAGLTALPNAAAGANAGLPLGDASARVDVGRVLGTAQTARDLGAQLDATVSSRLRESAFVLASGTLTAGSASSGTLAVGSSATTDFYKGQTLVAIAGTGAGQDALISAYNGGTRVATFADAVATAFDATTQYVILTPDFRRMLQLDAAITSRLASGNVTVGTNNDKTGYSLSAAGVQAIWDALTSALSTVGSVGKLLVDNVNATISSRLATSGYTAPPSAASVSTQVWTEPVPGAFVTGSAAAKLNSAASAGDPLGTTVPGAYALNTAGRRIGDFLDVAVSSRASGAVGGVVGSGSKSWPITVTKPDGVTPIEGVAVWVTSDAAGTNAVAGTINTDTLGRVNTTVGFMLDPGTYYLWRQHGSYNFANPTTFTVT